MNNDYVFLTMIWGLKIILQDFIYDSQCEFLPRRQLKDNVKTTLDILKYLDVFTEKQEKTGIDGWKNYFKQLIKIPSLF